MITDLFWNMATSTLALSIDGFILFAALVLGFFPLFKFLPGLAEDVPIARLVAALVAALLCFLIGFRIADEREVANNLRATVAAQQADLENAAKSAADATQRAAEIEGASNEQRKKDDEYIATLESRPACDLDGGMQPTPTNPAKKPAARPRKSDATCSRPGAGIDARCAWKLNTSALQEANRRLSESAAWYEALRHDYSGK